jgi:hypothetical protein
MYDGDLHVYETKFLQASRLLSRQNLLCSDELFGHDSTSTKRM